MARRPPGPRDFWLGATFARRFRHDPLGFITELGQTYGDIAAFRMGPIQAYFLNQPQWIHELLVAQHKQFRRPAWLVKPLAKLDGQGLVLTDGDLWQRQRRLVTPAFASKRFDGYGQTIVAHTQRLIHGWSAGSVLEIGAEMTRLTLSIIAKTLFDVEVAERAAHLGEAVRAISESYMREAGNPIQLPDWLPLPGKRRKRWAMKTLDDLVWEILRERRAQGEDRGDLLSMLLLAVDEAGDGSRMSERQARDEAITLFNAGHDTTAAALAWTWYAIARHPRVEAKLAAELDSVLGTRPATAADVAHLPYTQMVIKESLRLYPPTWAMFPREAVEATEIGGYSIAKGGWVYTFPFVTHRDPRYFADPLVFDPERFSPERAGEFPAHAYFPFGGGPRICVGAAFATMEMVLILATIVRRFRVQLTDPTHEVEPEPLIAMRPKGGLHVSLTAREAMACTA